MSWYTYLCYSPNKEDKEQLARSRGQGMMTLWSSTMPTHAYKNAKRKTEREGKQPSVGWEQTGQIRSIYTNGCSCGHLAHEHLKLQGTCPVDSFCKQKQQQQQLAIVWLSSRLSIAFHNHRLILLSSILWSPSILPVKASAYNQRSSSVIKV